MEQWQKAWENLLIAEGSDYTWWVDSMPYYWRRPLALFRKHLINVYLECQSPVPPDLYGPLFNRGTGKRPGQKTRLQARRPWYREITAGKVEGEGNKSLCGTIHTNLYR